MQHVNEEAFIAKWWSSQNIPLNSELEEWVKSTYSSKENFWKDVVFSRQEALLPPCHSMYGTSYDFYHDCILRYIKTNNIAFTIIREKDYPEHWTYEKIHHCVNYHIDKWAPYSLKPGQTIAIIGPPNLHFLISLLTAFRLGLKICYLPTHSPFLGRGFILRFLSEINPAIISSQDTTFSIDGIPFVTVNEKGSDQDNHQPSSFAYSASSEVQIALSLQQQEEIHLTPIIAHKTYLCAMRDGLITLNLYQHPIWAAPLACPILTEPFSTIMSLLCGVTRVYVSDEAIRKNPLILEDARINLLGVSDPLQKLWSSGSGVPVRNLKCLYKSPLDTIYSSWKSFIQLNKLEKIPSFDFIADNACGGGLFFSKPSLETYNIFIKPALGSSWNILDYNRSGQESLGGYGIYDLKDSDDSGNFTVSLIENQLMITGLVEPAKCGVTYPIEKVEKIISELSFVEGSVVHHILKAGNIYSRYFILLVFVNPLKEFNQTDIHHWDSEITKKISTDLGSGFLPDKIEYFPLMPKINHLGVDRNWCINQYSSGLLMKKRDFPPFRIMGSLKKLSVEYFEMQL